MSNEGDQCFQCQELGHNACNCPNVHCFECDEYGHIAVDCADRIPPSGTPACHKRQHTRHHARSTSRHHHWDRHRHSRSKSQSHSHGYQVTVMIIHAEFVPDHITDATTEALPNTITPALITIAVTWPHQRSSSCRGLSTHSRD